MPTSVLVLGAGFGGLELSTRLSEELAKVDEQAGYYDSLAGDMKRDVQPPSLYGLIRSLRW